MSVFNTKKKLKQATASISVNDITSTIAKTSTDSDTKYINITGDSMQGVLKINPYIQFPDDSIQNIAFSDEKNILLNEINDNVIGIDNLLGITTFNQPVNFQSTLTMNPNSLPTSYISGLNEQLSTFTSNILTNWKF
jgi:hypothetical protein